MLPWTSSEMVLPVASRRVEQHERVVVLSPVVPSEDVELFIIQRYRVVLMVDGEFFPNEGLA